MNVRVEEKVSVSSRPASSHRRIVRMCVCVHAESCVGLTEGADRGCTPPVACVCVYLCDETWGHAELSTLKSVWLARSLSLSLSPSLSRSFSLFRSPRACVYVRITSAWLGSGRQTKVEGEGEQYERGRAVLACGPRAGCYRLVAVLR